MKQVIAIIKPFKTEEVLRALVEAGYCDLTIREVKGYGRQKSYLSEYKDNEYSVAFLAKIELTVWVKEAQADDVMSLIVRHSRSGRMGDGKLLCLPAIDSSNRLK